MAFHSSSFILLLASVRCSSSLRNSFALLHSAVLLPVNDSPLCAVPLPRLSSPFHFCAAHRCAIPLLCFSRQLHAILAPPRLSIADHVISQPFNASASQIPAIPSLNSSLLFHRFAIQCFSFALPFQANPSLCMSFLFPANRRLSIA